MPKFPFTNYHELNLDWILKKVDFLFDASEENAATIRTYNARLTNAEQTATNAETAATAAQELADAAAENADSALSVAGTANTKADSALSAATTAAGAAAGAMTTAQEARQIAGNAQSAAADAGALANDASNAAAAAQQTADTNAGNIADLQTAVDTLSSAVTEIDNKADVIIDSASGSIASFADGANDMPIRSLVVNIEPVQAGSGDPSPTNVRPITGRNRAIVTKTGKNLFNPVWETRTIKGVTFTRNNDGSVTANGTATGGNAIYYLYNSNSTDLSFDLSFLSGKQVTFTCCPSGASDASYFAYGYHLSGTTSVSENGNGVTFIFNPETIANLTIQIVNGYTANNVVFKPQIVLGSSITAFEPYTATSINVSWQSETGTVYGGTLDTITGVLTVDRQEKILNGSEAWFYSPSWSTGTKSNVFFINVPLSNAEFRSVDEIYIICDRLAVKTRNELLNSDTPYEIGYSGPPSDYPQITVRMPKTISTVAELQTWLSNNNVHMVYELETPVIYQLTGQQLNTLLGTNNIYSNVGSIADVKYPADTKLYIDGKIAELQALVLEN